MEIEGRRLGFIFSWRFINSVSVGGVDFVRFFKIINVYFIFLRMISLKVIRSRIMFRNVCVVLVYVKGGNES